MTILISGASDGLGLALAQFYASRGHRLILLGRRPLKQLGYTPGNSSYCQVDLASKRASQVVMAHLGQHGISHLDLVIHNAGVGFYGKLSEHPFEAVENLFQVNSLAPISLTRTLLGLMHPYGKMVYISSVTSDLPVTDYPVYGASKAALDGFVRNLKVELPRRRWQLIHPGAIRTGMHQKSGVPEGRLNVRAFPDVHDIAKKVIQAIDSEQAEVTIGHRNRMAQVLGKTLPLEALMALTINAPRHAHAKDEPRCCVITGFASGIGRALAYRYGREGYKIIGIDHNAKQAREVQDALKHEGVVIQSWQADLGQDSDLYQLLKKLEHQPIHCLIHSAGINAVGHFAKADLAKQKTVFDVNLIAPTKLTAGLLAQDNFAPDARLIFIASLSHYAGYPGAAVYAASKDGLAALARNSYAPLKARGIHCLSVFPGPTRTPHAREHSPDNSREHRRMPPELLAEKIFRAARGRQRILVPALGNKLFALTGNLFPQLTTQLLKRGILDKLD